MKERIYNKIVKKDLRVDYEYDRYVQENIEEHHSKRGKRWRFLIALIWHYRIRKKNEYYYYPFPENTNIVHAIEDKSAQIHQNNHKQPVANVIKEKKNDMQSKPVAEIVKEKEKSVLNPNVTVPQKYGSKSSVTTKINSVKLPRVIDSNYVLDCAESTLTGRVKPYIWVKGMMEYELVSFDIFDTLLLRRISEPRDLFVLLGNEFKIVGFSKIRFEAEKAAREKKQILYGNREVNIFDIYKEINLKTGLNIEYGVKKEFEFEMEVCFANPYMKIIFDILKKNGKRIIITSDMYWPKEYLDELLKHCGYDGYEDILVSCEWKGGKRNGVLFKRLTMLVEEGQQIVHIGDNPEADIKPAAEFRISTRYYKNVQEIGNIFRENGMSVLIRSAYRGIVNSRMHNGTECFSEQYEYGFNYGGLFVLGYVNWIHKLALEKRVDKVLFMARDGYIYKKIYDKLYDDVKSEYALWSRVASMKYSCDYARDDFLRRNIEHREGKEWSIKSMLEAIDLQEMVPLLREYSLREDEIIHAGNKKQIEEFFVKCWEQMLEIQNKRQGYAKEYYKELIGDSKTVLLVDIGWRGDNQLALKRLIEEKWEFNCNVLCCMAATIEADRNATYLAEETLFSYMFSNNHNRMLFDSFSKNKVVNMALFEMFSQAPCPSFDGFDEDGNFLFGYAEVENYSIIMQVLQGIEDFCNQYVEVFGKYKYMMNISGYDAYLPFRRFIRNYRLAKKTLGTVRFQQVIGVDMSKQKTKTLLEVMRENNL